MIHELARALLDLQSALRKHGQPPLKGIEFDETTKATITRELHNYSGYLTLNYDVVSFCGCPLQ